MTTRIPCSRKLSNQMMQPQRKTIAPAITSKNNITSPAPINTIPARMRTPPRIMMSVPAVRPAGGRNENSSSGNPRSACCKGESGAIVYNPRIAAVVQLETTSSVIIKGYCQPICKCLALPDACGLLPLISRFRWTTIPISWPMLVGLCGQPGPLSSGTSPEHNWIISPLCLSVPGRY